MKRLKTKRDKTEGTVLPDDEVRLTRMGGAPDEEFTKLGLSPGLPENLNEGRQYIIGTIEYHDTRGEKHRTTFCYEYVIGDKAFTPYHRYNYMQ